MLLFIGSVQSCYEDETSNENNQPITTSYNATILSYLAILKSEAGKENGAQIEALKEAINLNTIHIYDLKSTEKLLIADISTLKGFESYNATKAIFFVLNNKIIHSKIVSAKYDDKIEKTNQLIISIFNKDKNKAYFTGTVSFYNMLQNMQLTSDYNNGVLEKNSSVLPKSKKFNKSNSCTDWYWVTTYSNGGQDWSYAYTTCTCDYYKSACGGGGGGSSSSGSGGAINYPSQPNDTDLFVYIDADGEMITKKYNAQTEEWELVSITLSQVVVTTKPKYNFLLFYDGKWPVDNQKIVQYDLIYTYDIDTGSWEAVPNTAENIAKAIEEQINDSQLDPCPKGVLNELKNTTVCDMANVLTKLGAKDLYNLNIVSGFSGRPANTTRNSMRDYTITVSQGYTTSTALFRASNILHEVVHAFFMSLRDDQLSGGGSAAFNEFPILFQAFCDTKYPPKPGDSHDLHHEEMANSYVNAIGAALQEFQTGTAPAYGAKPDQIYMDLAWGGLKEAPIFDKKFPAGSVERIRIDNRYACESNGVSAGGDTISPQTAVGKPCK